MQNTTEWKSSVYCFEARGGLSLLVYLKCGFMEAFGKRLQKQELELKINKVIIFYPLSLPDRHPSHELWDVKQLPIRDTQQLPPGCAAQLPEDLPRNLSTVLNLLWENRRSERANCMSLMFAETSSLSKKQVSKEPPCCFTLGGEVTAPTQTRVMHPTLFREFMSRQCSQLQGWILQMNSVLNSTFNEG